MNRQRPLFRCFLDDDTDAVTWYQVLPDNSPGDAATLNELGWIEQLVGSEPWHPAAVYVGVGSADWADQFWTIAQENRKATIYADD